MWFPLLGNLIDPSDLPDGLKTLGNSEVIILPLLHQHLSDTSSISLMSATLLTIELLQADNATRDPDITTFTIMNTPLCAPFEWDSIL